MFWASLAIMIVGFVGLIVCSKKQRVNPAMQPAAFGCLLVVLVGLGMFIYDNSNGSAQDMDSEMAFVRSKAVKAGEFLAKSHGGKKVLYVVYPERVNDEFSAKMVESFKATYGENADVVVASVTPPANYSEGGLPLEDLLRAKDFDALFAKYPDVGVIVTDIGLSRDAKNIKVMNLPAGKRPAIFLMQSGMLSDKMIADMLKSDKIVGVIETNTKADWNKKCSRDLLASFDIRYRVVDKTSAAAPAPAAKK